MTVTAKLKEKRKYYKSLHKAVPSTTVYYKACTKSLPVLLCTTKLAQSRSQYYCVLQSLHKHVPSTNVYYKACTKSLPVLLCNESLHKHVPVLLYTRACTNTFQYYCVLQSLNREYCVLQSLHKALPSTAVYYKAWTNTFQYCCILQSLHESFLVPL